MSHLCSKNDEYKDCSALPPSSNLSRILKDEAEKVCRAPVHSRAAYVGSLPKERDIHSV